MEEGFKEVRHHGQEATCSSHAQHFSYQATFLFVPSRICLFTVNTCHIATEILLNNNTQDVKLLGLEAFNEKTRVPDKK